MRAIHALSVVAKLAGFGITVVKEFIVPFDDRCDAHRGGHPITNIPFKLFKVHAKRRFPPTAARILKDSTRGLYT
jgi:hypothetical protein